MHSFERLSFITGYELDKFKEILNSDTPIMPDKEVLPSHLALLCKRAQKPVKTSSYILVSEENNFYRGVILEDVFNIEGGYGRYESYLTIAYKGSEGKQVIIKMKPYGSSNFYFYFENQSIRAYPIDFSESLFVIKERPLIEEYDEFEQYDEVSIGHNSNGFFFMDRDNKRISVFFDSIHRDPADCFVVEKDSLFGIANNLGKVILNPRFFLIKPFSEGLAAILDYKAWGFVNIEGNIVIPPQYETAEAFINGVSKVSVSSDRFGLINKKGNGVIIIKDSYIEFPEYRLITQEGDSFIGLLHEYKKNDVRWNYFSIPALNADIFITQKTHDYIFIGDCLIAIKDGHKYLYSYSGESSTEIDDCYILDYCCIFNKKNQIIEGQKVRHIIVNDLPFFYLVSRGNYKGVINKSGDIIVPIEYEYIGLLSSQVILASNGVGMRLFSTNPSFNGPESGNTYTQLYERIEKKEEAYDSKTELNQFYVYKTNKVGFIIFKDGVFKTIFPCVYDYIDYSHYSTYNNENKHIGSFIIDGIKSDRQILGESGNYIVKPKDVSWMTDFSYFGIAVSLKDDLFGLIDSHWNTLRDYSYETIFKIDAFHFLLSKSNHIELIRFNRAHEESIIMEFPGVVISRLSSFIFRILRSGKYFIFKYNQEKEAIFELLEQGFDNVYGIEESYIVVEQNGLSGCYDNDGRKLLDIKYESIVSIKNRNWNYQKESAFDLTVKKIIIGHYPVGSANEFICDLYNVESGNLLHIPKTWFYDESYKHKHPESSGIVLPGNWIDVKYVKDNTPSLGAYIVLNTCTKLSYIVPLTCQSFVGPFDTVEPFYIPGNTWNSSFISFHGLSTYRDGKRGLIRLAPFDVIPCVYDNPVYFVNRSSRFWIIEKRTDEVSEKVIYDSLKKQELDLRNVSSIEPISDGIYKVSVITTEGGKKCGLVNNSFRSIIPITFDSISNGNKGQFIVYQENRGYGIIDESGIFIYPLSPGRISYQRLWSENRGSYSFYDEKGLLSAVSEDGYLINDVFDVGKKEYIPNSMSHYFLKKEDSECISVYTCFGEEYPDIEDTYTEDDVTILKTKGGYFAINTQKRITPSLHEAITLNKRLEYLSVRDGQHRQFVSFNGETLGEIEGEFTGCFLYKEAGVITTISKKEDGQLYYMLFSLEGESIIDTKFSYIGSFHEKYATCVINSEYPIDEAFFKGIKKDEHFFYFNSKNYGQWGIINNMGEIVIPMRFDYIRPVKNGQTIYVKDHKYGLINLKDKYRTAPIFKYLFSFSEGLCAFREFAKDEVEWCYKHTNCGLINEKGQIVVPAAYNSISAFKEGIANVVSNCGFLNQIDREGNLLHEWQKLPAREDLYNDYDEGYSQSELDDMYMAAFEGDPSAQWNID